jgi:hypothetical protein
MGLNLRMFEPSLWRDLPRRLIDGASYCAPSLTLDFA